MARLLLDPQERERLAGFCALRRRPESIQSSEWHGLIRGEISAIDFPTIVTLNKVFGETLGDCLPEFPQLSSRPFDHRG